MGFFDRYKKTVSNDIYAVANAEMVNIEEANDGVFSKRLVGDGVAFHLKDGNIYSPADGVIEVLFPTKHAFAIRMNDGTGLLVHIGIDTVDLNGEGFITYVKQGDKVKAGNKIVCVDLDFLKSKNINPITMLIITEEGKSPKTFIDYQEVSYNTKINK